MQTDTGSGAAPAAPAERAASEYVILKGVEAGDPAEMVWSVSSETAVQAANKDQAIKAFTDTLEPEARNGSWKAVSATAWKGGQVLKVQTQPVTERLALD